MAERLLIASQFINQHYAKNLVLKLCGIAKSSYYYKPPEDNLKQKKGIAASEWTYKKDGTKWSNLIVVNDIRNLLMEEFVDYGYLKVTYYLQDEKGYLINHKKVYRLMKTASLLNIGKPADKSRKEWVKELVPKPQDAFSYWEFDIKFIYIDALGKYAPLLSVVDVYSRYLVGWILQWSIKKEDVKAFFDTLISDYILPQKVYVRCDNGSQFESNLVRQYFTDKGIAQEFTKPATPQQNAHIESYHSIIQSAVCNRIEFSSLKQCEEVFIRWQQFYNQRRIHGGIGYQSPAKYMASKNIRVPLKINTTQMKETG